MTITKETLRNYYQSKPYELLLQSSLANVGRGLNEEFPDILFVYDLRKIACANATIEGLEEALQKNPEHLAAFIKIKWISCLNDSLDGEFPPGEEPGEEDKAVVLEELPLYRNFLLPYLLEWDILNNRPDDLKNYLKCARIPHASAYEKRLKAWKLEAEG